MRECPTSMEQMPDISNGVVFYTDPEVDAASAEPIAAIVIGYGGNNSTALVVDICPSSGRFGLSSDSRKENVRHVHDPYLADHPEQSRGGVWDWPENASFRRLARATKRKQAVAEREKHKNVAEEKRAVAAKKRKAVGDVLFWHKEGQSVKSIAKNADISEALVKEILAENAEPEKATAGV